MLIIMYQIVPHFAVPFAFEQHPNPEALNVALRELFLKREAEGAKYANPNPYTIRNKELFESHFDLFDWPEPIIAELREFCLSNLMRTVAQLNNYDLAFMKRINIATEAWFHITRRNGFFGVHNHPMASWSGVYCVAPGEHDVDQADSGKLSFVHPNIMGGMYVDAGSAALQVPFNMSNMGYALTAGQLLLFPSWVSHYVMPFYGEGERITVAFNCAFQLRP
jgi:uncharacterized protein (TIGR02466 family)